MDANKKVIYEYAIKGVMQDIQELDAKIRLGCKYLDERAKGNMIDNTKLSDYELNEKVKEWNNQMKALEKLKDEIKWELV